jgi:tetrahydromethanopterin S-methyltransferase subunit B
MVNYKYNCDNCSLHTNSKQSYDRHLLSKRHKEIHESNIFIYPCKICKKLFKARVGRWHHSKKCVKPQEIDIIDLTEKVDKMTNILVDIKENQQPTTAITNNNNNNQNNHNYNVNLFLNEHCTNAKNFIDVINGIQLDTEYHEYISSADYVSTIVRLIKTELEKLPISERPIHCIKNEDEHQQILHIRDNNRWKKETELEWTQQIHNYYIDDHDEEPTEEDKKIIFYALKRMEDNIIEQIQRLYQHTKKLIPTMREYKTEMNYIPNKMRIIKCLLEQVNISRDELNKIIDEACAQLQEQIANGSL